MNLAAKKKRVVWAVDPLADDYMIQASTLDALTEVAPPSTHRIHPICVWPLPVLDTPFPNQVEVIADVERRASHRLKELVGTRASELEPLTLLTDPAPSRREEATHLLERALALGAELIALSVHTRRKASHFFLGSFAEALCLSATVPLLVTRPEARLHHWVMGRHVLFATDFSPESLSAFTELVASAKEEQWPITIFNKVIYPYFPMDERAAAYYGIADQIFRDFIKSAREDGEKLVDLAERNQVRARLVLDEERHGNVERAILKELRSDTYRLVALTARSGRLLTSRLGRTTRELIRNSPLPVWVIQQESRRVENVVDAPISEGVLPREPPAKTAASHSDQKQEY